MNRIESVSFERVPSYSSQNPNRFVGKVKYASDYGALELLLDNTVAEELMIKLAPLLVDHSQKSAAALAEDIIAQVEMMRPKQIVDVPAESTPTAQS